jgi:hypothetical protein
MNSIKGLATHQSVVENGHVNAGGLLPQLCCFNPSGRSAIYTDVQLGL